MMGFVGTEIGTVCPVYATFVLGFMGIFWLARNAGICIWGCWRWEVVESIDVFVFGVVVWDWDWAEVKLW